MKMNVNRLFDHDEGHYTSFVKITRPNKEENWNGFCEYSYIIKEAKRLHMSTDKLERLHEEYADLQEMLEDKAPSFDTFVKSKSPSAASWYIDHYLR